MWTLSHSFVLFYASSYCTSLGTPVVATTKELCTTTKVFVPCLLSLEVKCIFLHSGLLLSKIYFIKQTFVIKECVVFTCGPVSNEINHFHLISLCTDSYLTVCPGAGPVPRPGRERRRTRRYPLPSSSPHKPYRSLSKDTKRAPHSRRRKATPQPPQQTLAGKTFLPRPGGAERAGQSPSVRAAPRLRPPRPPGPQGRGAQCAAFVPSLHLVNRHEFTDGYLVALRCCNTSACVLVVLLFFGHGQSALCLCRLWYNDIGLSWRFVYDLIS